MAERKAFVKFTVDGPLIPVPLLQALEDGELVIFCGAGVSRRCGLPDFGGLVMSICDRLGRPLLQDEQDLFNAKAFDLCLGIIENRIRKATLRAAVGEILSIAAGADLSTHEALLQLATSRNGQLRLVTTNFDNAFAAAPYYAERLFDYAPYVPLPGKEWNSIVHLHGGLGNNRDPRHESLIFTSADFGRAYITEGWASRFLTELFRRSKAILFVGYSVSDPAIRYIVDAFAADRAYQDSHVATAYLLSGATGEQALQEARTWRSRGIVPILYDPCDNYRVLHETIQRCASRYRTGRFDRAAIVVEHGPKIPAGTLDQEFISQLTWALNEPNGHAARRFAALEPAAPLDWLEILETSGLFKLAAAGSDPFPLVAGLPAGLVPPPIHPVGAALCEWLTHHLAAPRLIEWTIKQGCHLHPSLADYIRKRLATLSPLLPKGPSLLWEFWTTERAPVYNGVVEHEVFRYRRAIAEQPWTVLMQERVLAWFSPTVQFKEPWRWGLTATFDSARVRSYAEIQLMPAAGQTCWDVAGQLLARTDVDQRAAELLPELTRLLNTGFSYLEFFEQVSTDYDGSSADRPAIEEHPQNNRHRQWTVYVYLIRGLWERLAAGDPVRAHDEVLRWSQLRYPIFRRLVLWSVGKIGGLAPSQAVEYLALQPPSTRWGLDTYHELLQSFARIGPLLQPAEAEQLTGLILAGSPIEQYRTDISAVDLARVRERAMHLRLAKLREAGMVLPATAQAVFDDIIARRTDWDRPLTERDEFNSWIGKAEWAGPIVSERQLSEYETWDEARIIEDLRTNAGDPETIARWRGLLVRDPNRSLQILNTLADRRIFTENVWATALDHLDAVSTRSACVRLYATFCRELGEAFSLVHASRLTGLIDFYVRENRTDEDEALWQLWDWLVEPATRETEVVEDGDPVTRALNSPIGHLTEGLLVKISSSNPATYDEIPEPHRRRLETLVTGAQPAHRYARVLLARAVAWLYRLNPNLATQYFISRSTWGEPEARSFWRGYLWTPRITPELWAVLRDPLLSVFPHSADLDDSEEQLFSFFAFLLLNEEYSLDAGEARHALSVISSKGRSQVAWYWWRQADATGDHGAVLFRERLRYLLTQVWPVELTLVEEASSEHLAQLAACCGTEFANAVEAVTPLLTILSRPHTVVASVGETTHPDEHPRATLTLLDAVIGGAIEAWGWQDLSRILDRIAVAAPDLRTDPRFTRLIETVHRFA